MMQRSALLLAVSALACNASSAGAGPDAGDAAAATCHLEGGTWSCPTGRQPTCPVIDPGLPCNFDGGACFSCSPGGPTSPGSGTSCLCNTANLAPDAAGGTWECLPSDFLCE